MKINSLEKKICQGQERTITLCKEILSEENKNDTSKRID